MSGCNSIPLCISLIAQVGGSFDGEQTVIPPCGVRERGDCVVCHEQKHGANEIGRPRGAADESIGQCGGRFSGSFAAHGNGVLLFWSTQSLVPSHLKRASCDAEFSSILYRKSSDEHSMDAVESCCGQIHRLTIQVWRWTVLQADNLKQDKAILNKQVT